MQTVNGVACIFLVPSGIRWQARENTVKGGDLLDKLGNNQFIKKGALWRHVILEIDSVIK